MQREISNSVFLGQTTTALDDVGLSSAISLQTILTLEKKFEKLENLSELQTMMLTLQDTFLVSSSYSFRTCLWTLILKKTLQARLTKIWTN